MILTTDNEITQRKGALPFEQIIESVKRSHLAAFAEKEMVWARRLHAATKETHESRDKNEISHQQLINRRGKKASNEPIIDASGKFVISSDENHHIMRNVKVACSLVIASCKVKQFFSPWKKTQGSIH